MLNVLLESKPRRRRGRGGVLASVILHVAVGSAAVAATRHVLVAAVDKPVQEQVVYVAPPPPPPPPPPARADPPPRAPRTRANAPAPPAPRLPAPPTAIPDRLPAVNLALPPLPDVPPPSVSRAEDFTRGLQTAEPSGAARGGGLGSGDALSESQVDEAVVPSRGNPAPRYPDALQASGVSGTVLVQFIVDSTGRVERESVKVLESTGEAFARSVRDVMPRLRFRPARAGGHAVRQLVQQPFQFRLAGQ